VSKASIGVAQLAGELADWFRRLTDIEDIDDSRRESDFLRKALNPVAKRPSS
jgi:hypothetical protein